MKKITHAIALITLISPVFSIAQATDSEDVQAAVNENLNRILGYESTISDLQANGPVINNKKGPSVGEFNSNNKNPSYEVNRPVRNIEVYEEDTVEVISSSAANGGLNDQQFLAIETLVKNSKFSTEQKMRLIKALTE